MSGANAAAWFLWWEVQTVECVLRNFFRPPGFIFKGEGVGGDKYVSWFVEKAERVNSELPSRRLRHQNGSRHHPPSAVATAANRSQSNHWGRGLAGVPATTRYPLNR